MRKQLSLKAAAQAGFTLIELIIVIVIIGILAAVAIPKYVSLTDDAQQAAVDGMAGQLASASAINFAVRSAKSTNGVAVADCDDVAGALQGGLSSKYTITSATVAAGDAVTCTLTGEGSNTATFTALGIS